MSGADMYIDNGEESQTWEHDFLADGVVSL